MARKAFNAGLIAVFAGIVLLGSALLGRYILVPDQSSRLTAIETRLDDVVASLESAIASRTKAEATPMASGATDPDFIRIILERLGALEARLDGARELRPGAADLAQTSRRTAAELVESGEATITTFSSPKTILGSFSSQAESSAWGDAAAAAIMQAYMTEFPRGDFFMNYGGSVSTDCRQSVCRIDLVLDRSVAQLDASEMAQVFQLGEFELLALSREVGDAGSMVVEVQRTPAPTISLYLERRSQSSPQEGSVPAHKNMIR